MPTEAEIADAIWDTVINGATARRIFEAWFEFMGAETAVVDLGYGGLSWRDRFIRRQQPTKEKQFGWLDFIAADDEECMALALVALETLQ